MAVKRIHPANDEDLPPKKSKSGKPNSPQRKTCVFLQWKPPPFGFFKLNADGACKGNNPGRVGCGSLIRNHDGRWLVGCARNIGYANSTLAEIWGLRDGLQLALDNNLVPIQVEIDSKVVRDLISTENRVNHVYGAIILECMELLTRLGVQEIQHTERECNAAADQMANIGVELSDSDSFCIFDSPPILVCNLLNSDDLKKWTSSDCNEETMLGCIGISSTLASSKRA